MHTIIINNCPTFLFMSKISAGFADKNKSRVEIGSHLHIWGKKLAVFLNKIEVTDIHNAPFLSYIYDSYILKVDQLLVWKSFNDFLSRDL